MSSSGHDHLHPTSPLSPAEQERVAAYYDGDPSWGPTDRAAAKAWIDATPAAAAYLAELQAIDKLMAEPAPELAAPVDPSARDRIAANLRAVGVPIGQPAPRGLVVFLNRYRRHAAWTGAIAALFAIALGLALWLPGGESGTNPDQPIAGDTAGEGEPTDPSTDGDGAPGAEMLALLDLLESDVPLRDLAALEQEDISVVGDAVYQDVLRSYDGSWEDDDSSDAAGSGEEND